MDNAKVVACFEKIQAQAQTKKVETPPANDVLQSDSPHHEHVEQTLIRDWVCFSTRVHVRFDENNRANENPGAHQL